MGGFRRTVPGADILRDLVEPLERPVVQVPDAEQRGLIAPIPESGRQQLLVPIQGPAQVGQSELAVAVRIPSRDQRGSALAAAR